ncbi:hypothetical protein BJV82DRAFT_627037 [Fennellomyces sp. T-0311]|nr:hypothetical protein BJV82DRAFT_627037 [Fennellomyces sp. T-0311]
MSASVAHLPTTRNWLPMPTGIGIDESFSRDLLRQFDKRRSRLHVEMYHLANRHSIHFQPHTPSPSSSTSKSHHTVEEQGEIGVPEEPEETPQDDKVRRRSGGNLFRRSSAYLRNKWRKARSDENFSTASLPPPSKIAINTTISIPHFQSPPQPPPPVHYATVQPPIITQYPPKPLKYSPVEPLEEQRKAMHRISLPILNRATFHPEKRRLSDSVDHRDTITTKARRWTYQIINCRPLKKSRKGKERAGDS